MTRMATHTVVTDSSHRQFLKEEGYGFIAEFWTTAEGLQVRPTNKGGDMLLEDLQNLVRDTCRVRRTP